VGLLPYAALLLFARAFYALGDSRTPAVVAIASAVIGVGVMVTLAAPAHGAARVAALGFGHSSAYALGALVLGVLLQRRLGRPVAPRVAIASIVCAAVPALLAWWVVTAVGS